MKVGEVHRFIIGYVPRSAAELGSSIFVCVKNTETRLLATNILSGPFMFYCDIAPSTFSNKKRCFITADQPHYNPNIMPGQSIKAELSMHILKDKYVWVVNVQSQIIFNVSSEVNFEIIVAREREQLHKRYYGDHYGSFSDCIDVQHLNTEDLWNKPPPFLPSPNKPIHLIVLTHGMYSNVTADLLYIKEQIEQKAAETGENVVVRGYTKNVCRTERGVKYLGRRVGEWVVKKAVPEIGNVSKISFIGHSLGGLIQTFAVAYIQHNYPEFFMKVQPENFITMASPLLGISNENPAYVQLFLSIGIVGKTGHDLSLQGSKPLVLLLPSKSTRGALRRFHRRTVYANVLHDGLVPLRTAALMFLDWNGLCNVYNTLKQSGSLNPSCEDLTNLKPTGKVAEIPADVENSESLANEESNGLATKPDDAGIEVPAEEPITQQQQTSVSFFSNFTCKIQSWWGTTVTPTKKIKLKKYQKYQTTQDDGPDDIVKAKKPIPKASVLSGIRRVLLPESPTSEFLLNPESRQNPILHDKIYKPSMIPKPKKRSTANKALNAVQLHQRKLEEKIARKWHQGLSWRKVLVNIPPDAHNSMIVRRKFANAYGWPIVDHMVENHFGERCYREEDLNAYKLSPEDIEISEAISLSSQRHSKKMDNKLSKVLDEEHRKSLDESRKDDKKVQEQQDFGNSDNESWIDDAGSICFEGPTGMLNTIPQTVNGQVQAMKDRMFPEEQDSTAINKSNEDDPVRDTITTDSNQVMNTYL